VNRFSEFSKLPKIEVHPESILALLEYNLRTLATTFKEAEFHFYQSDLDANPTVEIDASLFRQVLNNIIRNGIEANPNQKVSFSLTLKDHADAIDLLISNNGVPVPKNLVERMFDPYVSGKKGKDNMGLGLAIVKKIIIEHGGDITYTEINAQPTFSLSFRKV
jgi:signal transduction histidine kinase